MIVLCVYDCIMCVFSKQTLERVLLLLLDEKEMRREREMGQKQRRKQQQVGHAPTHCHGNNMGATTADKSFFLSRGPWTISHAHCSLTARSFESVDSKVKKLPHAN